jgi:lysophospholipase
VSIRRAAGAGGQASGGFAPTGNVLTHDRARFAGHRAQLAACPDLALGAPTWDWLDVALAGIVLLARPERLRGFGVPVN